MEKHYPIYHKAMIRHHHIYLNIELTISELRRALDEPFKQQGPEEFYINRLVKIQDDINRLELVKKILEL